MSPWFEISPDSSSVVDINTFVLYLYYLILLYVLDSINTKQMYKYKTNVVSAGNHTPSPWIDAIYDRRFGHEGVIVVVMIGMNSITTKITTSISIFNRVGGICDGIVMRQGVWVGLETEDPIHGRIVTYNDEISNENIVLVRKWNHKIVIVVIVELLPRGWVTKGS